MEIEVKESIALEDGNHEGVVTRVEYREEPYSYTDIYIKEAKTGMELKYGAPTSSGVNTKLMKLLSKFGEVKPGITVDPEKIMVNKQVLFMTMQEEKGENTYSRIVDGSIKPAPSQDKLA